MDQPILLFTLKAFWKALFYKCAIHSYPPIFSCKGVSDPDQKSLPWEDVHLAPPPPLLCVVPRIASL